MVGWTIDIRVFDDQGLEVGRSEAWFGNYGAMLSLGVHFQFLTQHLTFQRACWDGLAPGDKDPITYVYVDDADDKHPTGQVKLYWLLRSGPTMAPTLALEFKAATQDVTTPMLACVSDVVVNGSTAVHVDPTIVIESQLLFARVYRSADVERALATRRRA